MWLLLRRVWRIYASANQAIVSLDNGLSPVRCKAIIWTIAGSLLIGPICEHIPVIFEPKHHSKSKLILLYRLQKGGHLVLWYKKTTQWKQILTHIDVFGSFYFVSGKGNFRGPISVAGFEKTLLISKFHISQNTFSPPIIMNPVMDLMGLFCLLILTWISNYIPSKVGDEIIYLFPNFDSCTVEVWEWINNFISHLIMDVITYPYQD